ncbi:transposase [uncultured Arthrobacter sp.]|uniref:transposase n=1 Tax=uncultured Arthrobacter sp. TaxID=114050 RepID=UPI00344FAE17
MPYLESVLAPTLSAGRVVVMDNLSAHKGGRVREIVEARGCEVYCLPPYSPDLNPSSRRSARSRGYCGRPRPAPARR